MNTQLLKENEKRTQSLQEDYNPQTGVNCKGDRTDCGGYHLPVSLLEECPGYEGLTTIEKDRLRIRHDFEFWCWRCVKITDKMSGQLIPFVLNRPQRRLLAEMEQQRLAGQPIRIILLKARQWGGSTLVQVYIAWLQIVVFKGKNSIIVGHKRNSSFAIKNMMRTILANYPKEMLDGEEKLGLVNVRDSKDIQEITTRDCSISLTSSFSPDAARGLNLSFAHLSEVAFWNSNRNVDPNDLIRTVTGTIPLGPDTVIVMESTANGTNSFFYNEWNRAKEGKSAFKPVFVAWNEIEIYSKALDGGFDLEQCDDYERALWDKGCTLEQIYWYHEKRKEFSEHNLLKAEFPSDDVEAFENSMDYVFATHEQEQIVENVLAPKDIGEDNFRVWEEPLEKPAAKPRDVYHARGRSFPWPETNSKGLHSDYLAVLTIGSETDERNPSVMSIWHLTRDSQHSIQLPRLAAQWTGNLPLNNLAVMAMKWAGRYDNALLAVENNDLEASQNSRQQGVFVINEIFMKYRNLYYINRKNGFIMEINKKIFSLMFYELIISARNSLFIEHDENAARTIAKMIVLPNGHYYADKSDNQNLLINRAEAMYIIRDIIVKSQAVAPPI
jgi:hypothetical protein